jgi:exodeoxyribonuclease VII large subunit
MLMDWFGTAAASPAEAEVQTISGLSRIICEVMEDPRLQDIWVEGEITNHKHHPKGHRYFSLSEELNGRTYVINCAMWRSFARELDFEPVNGMHVLVWGSVEVYEPHGKYQLIVREMNRAGAGEKHLMVQRWKQMLDDEGLFEEGRKKALPRFPRKIGVVTSAAGAARHDIEQVIARRYPTEIVISPAPVQGEGAHREIAAALKRIDGRVDVIIIGRGGGSFEDLFEFNHPEVVRAIAACTTPVVSAIGHEVDVTLADFAADLRAATPSAAAELVVPDRRDLVHELQKLDTQLENSLVSRIFYARRGLEDLKLRIQPRRIIRRIDEAMQRLVDLEERLNRGTGTRLEREKLKLGQITAILEGLNPYVPLARGYCIIEKDDAIITSARALTAGDRVMLRLGDGSAEAEIEEVRYDNDV